MAPGTIVLFTSSEHGQSNSIMAVATELKLQGANVIVASDRKVEKRVAKINALYSDTGLPIQFEFIDQPEHFPEGTADILRHKPGERRCYNIILDVMAYLDGPKYMAIYERCRQILEDVKPDIAVCDIVHNGAREACTVAKVPYVMNHPTGASDTFKMVQPRGAGFWYYPILGSGLPFPLTTSIFAILQNTFIIFRLIFLMLTDKALRAVNRYRNERGLPGPMPFQQPVDPTALMYIVCSVPEVDFPLELPSNVVSVGPVLPPSEPASVTRSTSAQALREWINASPTILLNMGTLFSYEEADVAALAKGLCSVLADNPELQVLWKLPNKERYSPILAESFGPLGGLERVNIVEWVELDILEVLSCPTVQLAVHHGGANSFHEALYAAVPQVILAQWVDLYDVAIRSEWLGVGVYGNKTCAPQIDSTEFAAACGRLLGNNEAVAKYRRRARELSDACKRGGGRVSYAAVLSQLMERRQKGLLLDSSFLVKSNRS